MYVLHCQITVAERQNHAITMLGLERLIQPFHLLDLAELQCDHTQPSESRGLWMVDGVWCTRTHLLYPYAPHR